VTGLAVDKKVSETMDMGPKEIVSAIDSLATQLQNLRDSIVAAVPEFPAEAETLLREKRCLSCRKPYGTARIIRGCHEGCQKAIKRSIDRGELTESKAVSSGLMTPVSTGGRPKKARSRLDEVIAEGADDIVKAVKSHRAKKAKSAAKTKERQG
jgi:hypothetical protein